LRGFYSYSRPANSSRELSASTGAIFNNVLEQDHRAIKRRVRASQHFRSFWGAWCTIAGYEAIHLIRKRPSVLESEGRSDAPLQRSNVPGRLRCNFHSIGVPEEGLPTRTQHELLRIAQEAISNAVRHAKPNVVTVTLRWDPPNLILQVTDNGSGISSARLEKSAGVGLGSMRDRVAQIDAKLEIQTAAGRGTSIIVTVPISS
jgi:signal transduction histidine kinase